MAPVPVLCFPFAGAGASTFRRLQEYPDDVLRICPVQLPGREERFGEPAHTDLITAADRLLPEVLDLVGASAHVAMFGHSLGAMLAFEMAHRIGQLDHPTVLHVFVSGSPGPWTLRTTRATGLSDEDFLRQVRGFAGYTHPALEHPELREMLLPTLRADVAMHENYRARSDHPLRVPITSIRGTRDVLVTRSEAAQWDSATTAGCRQAELPGTHMYLMDSAAQLVALMSGVLAAQQAGR